VDDFGRRSGKSQDVPCHFRVLLRELSASATMLPGFAAIDIAMHRRNFRAMRQLPQRMQMNGPVGPVLRFQRSHRIAARAFANV